MGSAITNSDCLILVIDWSSRMKSIRFHLCLSILNSALKVFIEIKGNEFSYNEVQCRCLISHL